MNDEINDLIYTLANGGTLGLGAKEYKEGQHDSEFMALLDKATLQSQYNTKSGLLRILFRDLLSENVDAKTRLSIMQFIYKISIEGYEIPEDVNITITTVNKIGNDDEC